MEFRKKTVNPAAQRANATIEEYLNFAVRSMDKIFGRKADYDDEHYEFVGGANDELRKKHYDKSLRLLWKAGQHAEWSTFNDCTKEEELLNQMATGSLNAAEKKQVSRMKSAEFF